MKQRRIRRWRKITDDQIGRLLELASRKDPQEIIEHLKWCRKRWGGVTSIDTDIDTIAYLPPAPDEPWTRLGLDKTDWERLAKMNAADMPVANGSVNLSALLAFVAQHDRARDRFKAVLINRRVTELAAMLKAMGVGPKPKLWAANYYAKMWRAGESREGRRPRFKTGNALLTWVWRALNAPR
jgi:hypothetical protein